MENQVTKQDQYKTEVTKFEKQVANYEATIGQLLEQKGVSKKEFMVTVVNAVKRTPDLLNCDRGSLFNAILTSAELGLMPNTPFGLSFILPYNRSVKGADGKWQKIKEAQYQTGYQGWLELMHRQPRVSQVTSEIVYEGDRFEDRKGLKPDLIHEPCRPKDRGARIAAYAVVWLKDSPNPVWATVWAEEIDKIKAISQSAAFDNSPWKNEDKDPFAWQWRKTAIKQVAKMLPKTKELHIALKTDDAVEVGATASVTEDGTFEVVPNEEYEGQQVAEQREETSKKTQDAVKNKIIPTKEEVKPEPAQETVEAAHEEVVETESQSEEAPKADASTIDLIDEYVKKFSVMGIKSDRIISYYGIDHIHSMEDGHIQDMIGRYDAIINDTMKPNAAYPLVKK